MGRRIGITATVMMIMTAVLLLSSCSKGNSTGSEDLNTIRPYQLSSEESEIAELYTSNNAASTIVQFHADESYKAVRVGYDYYEKGKLIDEDCREVEMDLRFEEGPQATSGKICTMINGDNIDINVMRKGNDPKDPKDESAVGSGSSLLEDDRSFGKISSISTSTLGDSVKIEKDQKIPIWAYIGSNNDTLSVPGIDGLMTDKEVFGSYDKCCVFYAKFVK